MSTARSAPAFDPEVGAVWKTLLETVFEGRGIRLDAETLPLVRSFDPTTRETLLPGRPFDEATIDVPGPVGPMALSVLTPHEHVPRSAAVFWIHGGGMVAGTRFSAVEALESAVGIGALVVSIEYRLAPEHPAPAAVDDCYAGLLWFSEHAAELGVDRTQIVLAGGSAGGGLAAATALRVRDQGGPCLAGLMLCCPMLDDRMTSVAANQFGDEIVWTRTANEFGWRSLLGDRAGTDEVSIYDAPGRATDLSDLPPTFIDVGSADLFRDEDVAFASNIWASGGDCELHVWPGGYHGFELLAPTAKLSLDTYEARRRWLARTLAKASA